MPTTSTNMGLIVPVASTGVTGTGDPGPGYATNISNDLLSTIDAHDHSSGKGVQITPAGLNINADLSHNQNNVTAVRGVRFTSQASGLNLAGDIAELYVKTGDLWYVNSAGVQVQVTASSGLGTGPIGPTGGVGPTGTAGTFLGNVNVPTAVWQPTGQFSGSYQVSSWINQVVCGSGSYTGTAGTFVITPNIGATYSVLANIVGYDGGKGMCDVDLKGTYYGGSGTVAAPGVATYVGTFTSCYSSLSPVASGWTFSLSPSGSSISPVIGVQTGGLSGTVNFSVTMQVTQRGSP